MTVLVFESRSSYSKSLVFPIISCAYREGALKPKHINLNMNLYRFIENKHDNSHISELLFELSGDELRGSKVLENSLPALTMRIKGINPSYFLNKETMRSSNIRDTEMKHRGNLR